MRELGRRNAAYLLQTEWNVLRDRGAVHFMRWNAMLANAWCREQLSRRHYRELSEGQLRSRRKSDTVFVLGSGFSLNEISASGWRHIGRHDVFGFNASYYQQWVNVDFHLLRGGLYGELDWWSYTNEIASVIARSQFYRQTAFLLQGEYLAQFCNQLVGYRLLRDDASIFRYFTARGDGPPTAQFRDGIRHVSGTLSDVINCAYCLGWRRVVLAGVDLYDSRYFWLPPDETPNLYSATGAHSGPRNELRGTRYDDTHYTVRIGIVDLVERWRGQLEAAGCELSVYNRRSLLSKVVPVYEPQDH